MYRFTCVCSKEVETTVTRGCCPHCSRAYLLDWRADYKPTPDTKTVTL